MELVVEVQLLDDLFWQAHLLDRLFQVHQTMIEVGFHLLLVGMSELISI